MVAQPGSRYAARRARLPIIPANCTEPGKTCFCASVGTGRAPRAEEVAIMTGQDAAVSDLFVIVERAHADAELRELTESAAVTSPPA